MSVINQPVPAPANLGAADTANKNGVLIESAVLRAIAAYNSDETHNFNALGVDIFVVTTTLTGTATVTVKLQKKDPIGGTWVDIPGATTAAIATATTTGLTLYPGIAETANVSVSDHLGLIWRAVATVANDTATFSVNGVYLGG